MIKRAIGTMAMMAVLGVSSAAAQEREATVDAEVRGEPAEAPARTVAPVSTTVVVQAPARPEDAPPAAAPEDHARVRFHAALAGRR